MTHALVTAAGQIGGELQGVIERDRRSPRNAAEMRTAQLLRAVTPPEQWSYALAIAYAAGVHALIVGRNPRL